MVKRNAILAIINGLMMLMSISARADGSTLGLRCVVLDAGHGGKDPGAVAGNIYEKSINLGVALKLGSLIEAEFPNIKVVYTRRDDRAIDLAKRSDIANKARADLFISIHTNANRSATPFGTETYVMGLDKGNRNLEVAMRENSVISLEDDYTSSYEGYDPNSSESMIMFSLMQYAYLNQSLAFAEMVQKQYVGHAKRADKGVKQAGFLVLWRTSMPSILTEVGFISNPTEARFLNSDQGQRQIAQSLLHAFKSYKQQTEQNTMAQRPESTITSKTNTKEPPPNITENVTTARSEPISSSTTEIKYAIQIKSSTSKIAVTSSVFGPYAKSIEERKIDGRYKYFVESSFSYKEALLLQKKVRETYPDAFMVAFRDGVIVPLSQVNK